MKLFEPLAVWEPKSCPLLPLKSMAPFFAEEIRKYLEQKYGAKKLYEGGLVVQTGVDYHLQLAANRAIDHGLRQVDKNTRGWRRDKPNVIELRQTVAGYRNERWKLPMAVDEHKRRDFFLNNAAKLYKQG